jgi:hypothetical protein
MVRMSSRVEPGDKPHGTTFKFTCVPKYVVVDPESVTNRSGVRYATPGPPVTAPLGYATIELRDAPSWVTKTFALAASPKREPVAVPATRPREQRARRASTSSRASSDDPSPEPDPPLDRPLTRAQRDYLRGEIDKRRREVVRATEKVERSLERHWRENAA